MVTIAIIYDSQYWNLVSNLIWPYESLSIIGNKLKFCQDKKGVYCCVPTSETMSMKQIQITSVPTKPRGYSYHHQVGTWTLKCTRWNQITEKLTTPSFDIIYSVKIDHLPNVCYILIVLIQWKLITCKMFALFW